MFEYVDDNEFLHRMRQCGGEMMQELCVILKGNYGIGAVPVLVGSAHRKLIMQNANEPLDLDYNLKIQRCDDFSDCRNIKESVRKAFNTVLRNHRWRDCEDSTSALTAKQCKGWSFYQQDPMFSIDVCIIYVDEDGNYNRLIHKKTGYVCSDEYYWNLGPNAKKFKEKETAIKQNGYWDWLKDEYYEIKNRYLQQNDHNHPSFICYIEAINNTYNAMKHRR